MRDDDTTPYRVDSSCLVSAHVRREAQTSDVTESVLSRYKRDGETGKARSLVPHLAREITVPCLHSYSPSDANRLGIKGSFDFSQLGSLGKKLINHDAQTHGKRRLTKIAISP